MDKEFFKKIITELNETNKSKNIYQKKGWEWLLSLYKESNIKANPNNDYNLSDFDGWQKVVINEKIHAIFHLNKNNTNKWIISCHGYSASKEVGAFDAWCFNELGYNIMAFDFLNHGESAEDIVTFGKKEYETLIQVIDYVNKTFNPNHIGLIGFSMGAHTVNIYGLNPKANKKNDNVKFIISDGTYYRIEEILLRILKIKYEISEDVLKHTTKELIEYYKTEYNLDLLTYNLSELMSTDNESVPTLFFHTKLDKITNYKDSQIIYDLRQPISKNDEIKIFAEGEHLEAQNKYFQEYKYIFTEFISKNK